MPESSERATLLAQLAALPDEAAAAVAGLADAQLDTPYRDGGWTLRQVIHHLADAHLHACLRMRFVVAADHPTLQPYDQDAWAALSDARTAPVADSLDLLRGLHRRWVAFLRDLPEAAWQRSAFHPERGELTLADLLSMYARHGRHHVGQILALRASRQW